MHESGNVCLRRGAFDRAREAFESALAVAGRIDDLGGQARALSSLATVARQTGDFPAALGFLETSAAISRRIGEPLGEARAHASQGNVHLNRGQWAEARRCYEPALRSMRALGARHDEAVILNNMSVASSSTGDYEGASRDAAACLELMRELGDRWATAGVLDNLGVLDHRRGQWLEARRLLGESVRLRRDLGDRNGLVDSLLSLALVESSLASTAAAIACTDEALAASEGQDEPAAVARGLAALCSGDTDEATLRAAAAGTLAAAGRARERGDAELAAGRALPALELLARIGDWSGLETLARDEVERCAALGMVYEEAWARLLLARAALGLGRAEEAAREARATLASAERFGLQGLRWTAAAWLADAFGETDPALASAAADALERFLDGSPAGERMAFVDRAGILAILARWADRATKRGDSAGADRLRASLETVRAGR
jgi:tetratricopeptide (TPR) repeat protein